MDIFKITNSRDNTTIKDSSYNTNNNTFNTNNSYQQSNSYHINSLNEI